LKDNVFETMVLTNVAGNPAVGHNGYRGTASLGGANNVALTVCDYQTGPLGSYYYPTNGTATNLFHLIDAGSRNAADAGLYHSTVLGAARTREGNGTVDIGFHYAGVDGDGMALDSDGDGLADYLEDRNGNGTHDSGETDWEASDSGLGMTVGLEVFTPMKSD